MPRLVRFGISLDEGLSKKFDILIRAKSYTNRSEAIRDLIRDELVKEEWTKTKEPVSGVISLVYDHHKRELIDHLINIQHDHQRMIIASQHIHLDHDNCLEVVVIKGKADEIKSLASKLRSVKGVKHGELVMTTVGKDIK
jgi:CopG family transcriptional regulator, nickel-responsive regulator